MDLTKVLKTDTKITYSNNKSKSRTKKTNNINDKKDNDELNVVNDLLESLDEIEK